MFGRPAAASDGGSARLYALSAWVESRGGHVLDLAGVAPGRSKPARAVASVLVFVRTLLRTRADTVDLEYPGFPAFGVYYPHRHPGPAARLRCALAYSRAHAVIGLVRLVCRLRGQRLTIGIGDVPSQELHLPERRRLASERLTARYERALVEAADAVWVITPQERDLLVRLYDVPAHRFVIAPNGNPPVPPPPARSDDGPVHVVYAGSLSRDRASLTDAIRSALAVDDPAVHVSLAGEGGEWVASTFADPRVEWLGVLSEVECYELVARADVGLLVYFADEPYYELVHPTKLSLYVASGVAIASGDAAYVADFVTSRGIGVVAPRGAFPEALRLLIADGDRRRRCAANALTIREDFFWEAIFDRALEATNAVPG